MDLSNDIVVHKKIGEIEILQFRKLLEFPNIKHAYALKPLDFRRHGEEKTKYLEYEKLLNSINIKPSTLVKLEQTHTDTIIDINKKQNENSADMYLDYLENVDAAITNKSDITIATTNADCILMIFFESQRFFNY